MKGRETLDAYTPLEEPREPCVSDVVHLLRNYEDCLRDLLYEGVEAAEEKKTEKSTELTQAEERVATKACAEDGLKVEEAQARYLSALAVEHETWYKRESDLQDTHVAARRYELEVVEKHLVEQGRNNLQEVLSERCDQHLALLSPGVESGAENRFVQAEKARQEWTTEVCKAVIMEMRKEWRAGQRKVLQQLAGELRAERKAAADALERQITTSKRVSDALKGMWADEIQQAQEELDQVAEAYKRALKIALEAKLREARQHAKEQAEFFQKEIREALLFEQKEYAAHQAQLRRMRLAMLKWRFDYTADAKRKAAELVARGVLAKLSAAGLSVNDFFQEEMQAKKDARKMAKRLERYEQQKEARKKKADKAEKAEEKAAEKAEKAAAKAKAKSSNAEEASSSPSRRVMFADEQEKDEDEDGEGDDDDDDDDDTDVSSSDVSDIQVPADWVPDQELGDCRKVIDKIWGRIPNAEEEAREFLFKLEEIMPYEEEILIMYEEELMRHGVVSALDATDGRAEELLQTEREATAQQAHADTQVEIMQSRAKKKKGIKPAVPTVKRRVHMSGLP